MSVRSQSGEAITLDNDSRYTKCFNPNTLEILHLKGDVEVSWVYVLSGAAKTQKSTIKDVPVFGLFNIESSNKWDTIWQKLPK